MLAKHSTGDQNVFRRIGFLALLLLPTALIAQSPQSAVGGEASLWAGAEFSSFNPDYSCSTNSPFSCSHQLYGPTALFDFNFRSKWSAEGEARWLHWNGVGDQTESDYLIGPRYRFIRYHKFSGYAKVVFGGGWITTPNYPAAGSLKGSYFVYAPGATVDYRLSRHFAARVDYEYQFWPSFAGPPTFNASGQLVDHNSGLTPNGFSAGVMYKFLGQ